jgi:hypothetical protein
MKIRKPLWPWSYGSWAYNYLCNQCLSPLILWVRISIRVRCTILCDKISDLRQVGGFFCVLRFPPQQKWRPRYNWNIVESGIKHHQTNKKLMKISTIIKLNFTLHGSQKKNIFRLTISKDLCQRQDKWQ